MTKQKTKSMKIIRWASLTMMFAYLIIGIITINIPKYRLIGISFYLIAIMFEIAFFSITIIEDIAHKNQKV